MRLTLPNMSMVITFFSLLKNSAGQWNTLVNFESAQLALSGQFYIGLNSPSVRNALQGIEGAVAVEVAFCQSWLARFRFFSATIPHFCKLCLAFMLTFSIIVRYD
jgi:hypothetical protein